MLTGSELQWLECAHSLFTHRSFALIPVQLGSACSHPKPSSDRPAQFSHHVCLGLPHVPFLLPSHVQHTHLPEQQHGTKCHQRCNWDQPRDPEALQLHRPSAEQDHRELPEPDQCLRGRLPVLQHYHHPGESPGAGGRHLPHPPQPSLGICLHCQHHTQRSPHRSRLPGEHLLVWQPDLSPDACSVALQRGHAVCGPGSLHIQFAADCCGALHHYDEATSPEVNQKDLLSNLWLGGALLGFGAGYWLSPLAGLELCVQPGWMLHPASSLLQDLHLFFSHYFFPHPSGYRCAVWCHLLPRAQECSASAPAQSEALLSSAEDCYHHCRGLYALLGAALHAVTGRFLLCLPPVRTAVQR